MKTGYKATYNLICRNHKFEIGQIYELPNKPIPCEYGFHYCVKAIDVLEYYPINHEFCLLEIEDLSEDTVVKQDKSTTNKIRIVREIEKEEYRQLMGFIGNELTRTFSNGSWEKRVFDERNNEIYYEDSSCFCIKCQYDERNNLIYREDNNGYWRKQKYDKRNNCIYFETNSGYWEKQEFDERNNCIYYEDSSNYWYKKEFNDTNNCISFEDSSGYLVKYQCDK